MLPDPDESNNPFEDTDEFSEEEQKVDLFEPEFEFDHDPDDMYEQPIPQQSTPPPKAKPTPIIPPPKPPLKERIRSWFSIKNYASMKARYHAMKESVSDDSKEILHKSHVSQIYHPEIALLMVMNFVFWFTQTTFLMFASYILPIEYDWPYFYVGLTYVLGFVIIIFILILMYFLREGMMTKHLYVVVIGQALTQISLGLLIYEGVPKSVHDRSIVFIVCGVLVFGSIPCTLVSFKAIMTSLVRPGIQGTLQGVTSSIVRLAVIMGLLLSIVMVQGRQIYASIMTAFCFLTLIAFFLASDRIRLRQREARDGGHKLL